MANKDHLVRLRRGVRVWNAWRRENPTIQLDFHGADLGGANLMGVDLTGVDLRRADLTRVDLHLADLTRADLGGASIGGTTFADVDLSVVQGLDTIEHVGPSTIGIDTLYRSNGQIPEAFLRGAGVPEDFITYAKSLVGRPFEFYSCFISYNHDVTVTLARFGAADRVDRLEGKECGAWTRRTVPALGKAWP